jgi:hypothetical protein
MEPRSLELKQAAPSGDLARVRALVEAGADISDSPQSWASWHWRPKPLIDLLDPREATFNQSLETDRR